MRIEAFAPHIDLGRRSSDNNGKRNMTKWILDICFLTMMKWNDQRRKAEMKENGKLNVHFFQLFPFAISFIFALFAVDFDGERCVCLRQSRAQTTTENYLRRETNMQRASYNSSSASLLMQ